MDEDKSLIIPFTQVCGGLFFFVFAGLFLFLALFLFAIFVCFSLYVCILMNQPKHAKQTKSL